ncbi:unnamed protein product [Musa acuminata subsp. malaccensis]|uniref:Auxin efflux carrier component n=1 Tax=Musa acuminata subsp. malaccensis TaxID=214687 RepID=A0A804KCG1_MUSAM|nr:unnamed protein product [Musa acuminata subsp. malaccensis]
MISWHDLNTVLVAVVPLYVAMVLAYGSVRWWGIFSPEQCAGINRFVAVFAVPLLSFHFISTNDPYAMNLRFVVADTLQKLLVLAALAVWSKLLRRRPFPGGVSSLDLSITAFSLSTLPNTLVIGIPLLVAMYGPYSGSLMVQVVVLQCIIWYTLMLFLFEYRAARLLVADQFPDTAASIVSFRVDHDVDSLDAGAAETAAEFNGDGKIYVTVRKSTSSRRSTVTTPRPSNLTGVEIHSLSSSRNTTPRGSNCNNAEFPSPTPPFRSSSFGPADIYSLHSSLDNDHYATEVPAAAKKPPHPQPSYHHNHRAGVGATTVKAAADAKELHMFVWSSSPSPVSDHVDHGAKEIPVVVPADVPFNGLTTKGFDEEEAANYKGAGGGEGGGPSDSDGGPHQMPPAGVMTRLILIMVWRKLVRNPNTCSSLVGLLWSLVAFRWNITMPKVVEKSISILSDAGLGMAMFSLGDAVESSTGLFMALQPRIIACGNRVAALAMVIRFVAGPATMAVSSVAVGLRGTLLHVAIVQAALPQGIVPFVFAKEYNLHPAILSTAVIFGMLIALPITLLYYILLGL